MAFPAKDYDRLRSLQKKWKISQDDMFYAIENGILRTCVWLPLRYVERFAVKGNKFIFEKFETQCGYVGVRPEDCRRICSTGCAKLREFNSITQENNFLRLPFEPPQPAINVRIQDLVVLQADIERFEEQYGIVISNVMELRPEKKTGGFVASEDYRYVKLDELEFHFGDIQARIIQLLHDASLSHKPWVHGKTLIFESGSNAVRVRDLFKTQKHWRELVISNRGYYRLNVPLEMPSASSIQERMQKAV
jgi:hypothetical protein